MDAVIPLGLFAAALAHARGVGVLWRRGGFGSGISVAGAACFHAGLATLVLALMSPLDDAAHAAFSFHMAQHMLLILVAAPLLAAGSPLLAFLWAAPRRLRLGAATAWRARPAARTTGRLLTSPLVVWALAAAVLWVWHLPGLYQAAVLDPRVHAAEHASLLVTASLFWWLVLGTPSRKRAHGGAALLLVFGTKVQSATLGALITFAPRPLYPVHERTVAAWGMTPMQDQQIAGLVMGTPTGLVYLITGGVLFLSWLRAIERAGAREDRWSVPKAIGRRDASDGAGPRAVNPGPSAPRSAGPESTG